MSEKHDQLFSLPGVVGFGYGKKIIKGQPTEREALVVFVEKKLPLEELKDDEIIPASINDSETDVIELGEVSAYQQDRKDTNTINDLVLGLFSVLLNQESFKVEKISQLQKALEVVKCDLEKIKIAKKTVSELSLSGYKKAAQFSFQELSSKIDKDLKIIKQISEILSTLNLDIYKKAANSFTGLVREQSITDLVQEKLNWLKKFKEALTIKKKVSRTAPVRPAMPGLSIGHYKGGAGTFGAVVYDRNSGEPMILSNNHVLANTSIANDLGAKTNDVILQPAAGDGKSKEIGKLAKYAVLNSYPQANIVDCALAKPVDKNAVKPEILEIGKVKGITDPVIGMKIQKSGRTTGLTSGEVIAVEATLKVNYGAGRTLLFENQIIATKMSEPGDSGSLVLDMNNKAIGLLFAGSNQSTIINPIDPVLDILDVKLL